MTNPEPIPRTGHRWFAPIVGVVAVAVMIAVPLLRGDQGRARVRSEGRDRLTSNSSTAGSVANGDSDVGPRLATSQLQGDHWHVAFGAYVCNRWLGIVPEFEGRAGSGSVQAGIHSHGDGLIHIHPFVPDEAGDNATIGTFLEFAGITITEEQLSWPDGTRRRSGESCASGPGRVRWTHTDADLGRVVEGAGEIGSYKPSDQDVVSVFFVPDDFDVVAASAENPGSEQLAGPTDFNPNQTTSSTIGPLRTTTTRPVTVGNAECGPMNERPASSSKQYKKPPPFTLDPEKRYRARIRTACGDITLRLDAKRAPIATNNFVFLAREGFYDGLTFHRLVSDFVIQGGDPSGDGTGTAGYTTVGETPTNGYPIGSIAMAKTGSDPPGTLSSQFFISVGRPAADLPNDYARFGRVIRGRDVLRRLMTFASDGDGVPTVRLSILSVTITETPA